MSQELSDYIPEWHVATVPVDIQPDPSVHTEQQDGTFQAVYDQLDLIRQIEPRELSHHFLGNKALRTLGRDDQDKLYAVFIQPVVDQMDLEEANSPENHRREILEDAAGKPANEARTMAKGESLFPPKRAPRKKQPHYSHRGGRSYGEPGDSFFDNPISSTDDLGK